MGEEQARVDRGVTHGNGGSAGKPDRTLRAAAAGPFPSPARGEPAMTADPSTVPPARGADGTEPVLVAGRWRPARVAGTFRAVDPATGRDRPECWPVSAWSDVAEALDAAVAAAAVLQATPAGRIARFLEGYADRLAARGAELVAVAHAESGLDERPRLLDVELPRTLDQLRQAAAAAREGTWRMGMIDSRRNIRSAAFGLGPVVVFPPANFPLAYGAVSGGDFASAIAAGNPVIAKAHPGNPGVSALAAREAFAAVVEAGLPPATVQLLHGIATEDGPRLVADPRVGGTGFTGGQDAGRTLFAAAAAAGRVMWVEMGSINPVVLLPAALAERAEAIADELTASVTGSAGQFCTKPGLVFLVDDAAAAAFTRAVAVRFAAIGPQVLLGRVGRDRFVAALSRTHRGGRRRRSGVPWPDAPGGGGGRPRVPAAGTARGGLRQRHGAREVPRPRRPRGGADVHRGGARRERLLRHARGRRRVRPRGGPARRAGRPDRREPDDDGAVGHASDAARRALALRRTAVLLGGGHALVDPAVRAAGVLRRLVTGAAAGVPAGRSARGPPLAVRRCGLDPRGARRTRSAVVALAVLPDPLGRLERLLANLLADDRGTVAVDRDARQAARPGDRDHARRDEDRHEHQQQPRAPAGLGHRLHGRRQRQRRRGQFDHLLGVGFLARAFA
ncbi:MAG: aldehyde dehydrogenase family protein [Planctomycetia bacterium]|nr:aldehyde dehydrogenase family protein [Planctomycetia bacterium]